MTQKMRMAIARVQQCGRIQSVFEGEWTLQRKRASRFDYGLYGFGRWVGKTVRREKFRCLSCQPTKAFVAKHYADSVDVSAVVNMAHGRLGDYFVKYISEKNIPLFSRWWRIQARRTWRSSPRRARKSINTRRRKIRAASRAKKEKRWVSPTNWRMARSSMCQKIKKNDYIWNR